MNLSLPQIVAGAVGALLIYAAIKDASPITVVKDALKGQTTPAGSGSTKMPDFSSTGTTGSRIENRFPDETGSKMPAQPLYRQPTVGWVKTGV